MFTLLRVLNFSTTSYNVTRHEKDKFTPLGPEKILYQHFHNNYPSLT